MSQRIVIGLVVLALHLPFVEARRTKHVATCLDQEWRQDGFLQTNGATTGVSSSSSSSSSSIGGGGRRLDGTLHIVVAVVKLAREKAIVVLQFLNSIFNGNADALVLFLPVSLLTVDSTIKNGAAVGAALAWILGAAAGVVTRDAFARNGAVIYGTNVWNLNHLSRSHDEFCFSAESQEAFIVATKIFERTSTYGKGDDIDEEQEVHPRIVSYLCTASFVIVVEKARTYEIQIFEKLFENLYRRVPSEAIR
jgi:hypothetical protein